MYFWYIHTDITYIYTQIDTVEISEPIIFHRNVWEFRLDDV